jgi:hypothetical protein
MVIGLQGRPSACECSLLAVEDALNPVDLLLDEPGVRERGYKKIVVMGLQGKPSKAADCECSVQVSKRAFTRSTSCSTNLGLEKGVTAWSSL